jgi:hypothetical protein
MDAKKFLERQQSMSNDIRSILDRLATVEGRLSPAQQKVPQLPALFKPRHIRALGAKTDPAHPMDGYMVGDSVEPRRTALEEAMAEIEEDMISKVKKDLTTYLDKLEKKVSIDRELKDKAKDAVEKRQPEEDLDEFAPVGGDDREPDEEEILRQLAAQWWNGTEQQMVKAQNTLAAMGWEIGPDESGDDDAGVYVYRIGDEDGRDTVAFAHSDLDLNEEIDTDPAAMQGPSDPLDSETAHSIELGVADKLNAPQAPQAPQATFEMADGIALECWGNDDSGYELRHGEKRLPSRFKSLDDAGMAVKLYQARRRQQQQRPEQDPSQDYIEER